MKNSDDHDAIRGLRASLWSVAITGVVFTLATPFVLGSGRLLGVGLGAAIAVVNLWAIALVVRGFLRGAGVSWGALALTKLAALLFVVVLIVKNGWADVLALACGYAALPFGIVIAELRGGRAAPPRHEAKTR